MMRTKPTAGPTAAAALSLLAGTAVAALKPANLQLIAGAHVAVVNLLDPEVTHFHASRHLQNSFLKTYTLEWSVSAMLMEAVRERLTRSEEHTSELQSRLHLVCRLLLEKKKSTATCR